MIFVNIIVISLQGEGEKKTEAAPPVVEETENEKYKRARKLYSLRMENLIKARLNQSQGNSTIASNTTTSNNVQTSRPAAALSPHQGGLDVHPEPGNLLKGIDHKTIRKEGFRKLHPTLPYTVLHIFTTLFLLEINEQKNCQSI